MERKIETFFRKWQKDIIRKPLILYGPKQVGKTFSTLAYGSKEYKNVIYFSGHSHWMFELEIYNENLNVSNFDGEYCYMVHNPSVCEPRWIGEDDSHRTSKTGVVSEGWIIEMYDDFMILIPVDFISQVFYTEYMEIIPLN
jgi:hypothetical protein